MKTKHLALILLLSSCPALLLAGTCEQDIDTYCNDISPGRGRIADCLYRFRNHVSDGCKDVLKKYGPELKAATEACQGDAYEFCRDVRAGRGRVKACLMENAQNLTPQCREKVLASKPKP